MPAFIRALITEAGVLSVMALDELAGFCFILLIGFDLGADEVFPFPPPSNANDNLLISRA